MNAGIEPGGASLVERAKAIILKPNEEWPKIEAEEKPTREILTGYIVPLALIAPIAGFIGGQVFGFGAFGFSYRPGIVSALIMAAVSFVLALITFLFLALIADTLSPKFGGEKSYFRSFKLVAYASTAAWLAGIFALVPALGFFGLLGLYSIYLFYTGTGPMLKVPKDKAMTYTAVVFVCAILLNLLVGALSAANMAMLRGMGLIESPMGSDGTLTLPGGGKIETGKMEDFAKRAEKIQKGEIKAVPTQTLKALLPDDIDGFERTGFSSQAIGAAGSGVEGTYKSGDYTFDLRINDMLALSGLAGLGASMGIEHSKEDDNGYEHVGVVDGRWRTEKWDNRSSRGSYGIMIADRFMVEASGRVEDIDVLKDAVAAVDGDDLKDLAD